MLALEDELADVQRQWRVAKTALARWVGGEQASQTLAGEPDIDRIHFDVAELESHLNLHPDLLMLASRVEVAETEARGAFFPRGGTGLGERRTEPAADAAH